MVLELAAPCADRVDPAARLVSAHVSSSSGGSSMFDRGVPMD
jgi:hypothetical protein